MIVRPCGSARRIRRPGREIGWRAHDAGGNAWRMPHEQLIEYARTRISQGATRADIEAHLRAQKYGDDVVAGVLAAIDSEGVQATAPVAANSATPRRALAFYALAGAALLLLVGGLFAYRQFAAAQAVRALVKNVRFEGNIKGQVEGSDRTLELVQFRGALDTADLGSPKAAMKLELDQKGKTGKDLKKISPATDGRFIASALRSIAAGGNFFGGADLRFAEKNVYFHLDNTPFTKNADDPLMAIVGALAGPQVASNPWVRVPAGPAGTSETQAAWALLFRPTEQVFGSSKELRFEGKEKGEDLGGTPTEIHRYTLNGKWMSKELRRVIGETIADENMAIAGFIQGLATGKNLKDVGSALDTLTCSDGAMKVWVGKNDTLPRRIVIETNIREGKQVPLSISLRGEVNATYGAKEAIDFPQESVTFEELKKSGPFSQFF
jgi:hypothetical protein